MTFKFSEKAETQLRKLDKSVQQRIAKYKQRHWLTLVLAEKV